MRPAWCDASAKGCAGREDKVMAAKKRKSHKRTQRGRAATESGIARRLTFTT
jgi:hypothetical protein